MLCLEKEVTHSVNPVRLAVPAQWEERQQDVWRCIITARDGWFSLVPSSQSIFLSDERGERQHAVIFFAATAGNCKSPAQSHPRFDMAEGRCEVIWKGGMWWNIFS